jgi:hypothetical protein
MLKIFLWVLVFSGARLWAMDDLQVSSQEASVVRARIKQYRKSDIQLFYIEQYTNYRVDLKNKLKDAKVHNRENIRNLKYEIIQIFNDYNEKVRILLINEANDGLNGVKKIIENKKKHKKAMREINEKRKRKIKEQEKNIVRNFKDMR